MWLDQDLLEVKENRRRGGMAAKTALPTANNPPAANSQLVLVGNQNKSNDKSSQAFGYAKGFSPDWVAGQKHVTREIEAEHAVISKGVRLVEETRIEAHVGAMDKIQAIVDAIGSRDVLTVDEMKSALMEAILISAEALLEVGLSGRETGAKSALKRILSMSDPKEIIKVNMNPQDVGALSSLGVECPVKLVPDAEFDPEDAVTYMPEGLPDAGLSLAVERTRETLAAVRVVEE